MDTSFTKDERTEECTKNMVVAVRIRPLSKKEESSGLKSCCQTIGDKLVAIKREGDAGGYLKSQMTQVSEYAYDEVFDARCTQQDVYERTAKPFIPNVIAGKNVTVFAYGATGAGKTHTMLGDTRADALIAAENHSCTNEDSGAGPGIIPNAVKDVFAQIARKESDPLYDPVTNTWTVMVSFIEVYNEQVYDLLDGSGKVLAVREDQEKGKVVVAGVTEQAVKCYEDVLAAMTVGNRNRKTEATLANAVSSRSHAVLQLIVRHNYRNPTDGREMSTESKLSLIDLAGSERAAATNNRGARLQEGANINKSLLALANCINALAENGNSSSTAKKLVNVKYRDSKLTHLLKSSLEGNCNLIMIANINPADSTYEDSHNTLKYANRAKNIKVNPVQNKEITKEANWVEREMKLREENSALRQRCEELSKLVLELQAFKDSVLRDKIESSISAVAHMNDQVDAKSIGPPAVCTSPIIVRAEDNTQSNEPSGSRKRRASALPTSISIRAHHPHQHARKRLSRSADTAPKVAATIDAIAACVASVQSVSATFSTEIAATAIARKSIAGDKRKEDIETIPNGGSSGEAADVDAGNAVTTVEMLAAPGSVRFSHGTSTRAPCLPVNERNRRSLMVERKQSKTVRYHKHSVEATDKQITEVKTSELVGAAKRRKSIARVTALLDSIIANDDTGDDNDNSSEANDENQVSASEPVRRVTRSMKQSTAPTGGESQSQRSRKRKVDDAPIVIHEDEAEKENAASEEEGVQVREEPNIKTYGRKRRAVGGDLKSKTVPAAAAPTLTSAAWMDI